MRLATTRGPNPSAALIVGEGDQARCIDLPANDLGDLLRLPDWRSIAEASNSQPGSALSEVELAAPTPRPAKVICLGLNYRSHILEMGRDLPTHPTLFAKFASTLLGPGDDIRLPEASSEVDWEAELAVIIGRPISGGSPSDAIDAIAGYTILNDVSMRDWQWRTTQWLQGKAFDATTPVGPFLVTADEVDPHGTGAPALKISCSVDGEVMQEANTGDLLFSPADAVAYISQFTLLEPGDIVATGTPGGVGAGRSPKRFLRDGETLTTEIEGLGRISNRCSAPRP